MVTMFGPTSTTDQVLEGVDLSGRRILVTGVSSGLGVETARALCAHGAHVVGTARDLGKAEQAISAFRQSPDNGGGRLELVELDLASLDSVRACANRLLAANRLFDVVIANAGLVNDTLEHTADGFEMLFGTNHLGHFVLVNRLAPLIRPKGGRVVVVSSAAHTRADVDLDDPNFERTAYDPSVSYGRSKTANVLFAVEFDRRHRGRGIRATAVHPGGILTGLQRNRRPEDMEKLIAHINTDLAAQGKPPYEFKTIPQGAATSVWAAVVADGGAVGCRYCEDCHVVEAASDSTTIANGGVSTYALSPTSAKLLWEKSEEMTGERFGI